jgi:hypothetical protein
MAGVVIGAPHSGTAPGTAALARLISDRTGAGFVAAYGFKSKRVSVEQPVVRSNPHQPVSVDPLKRRSVFAELKKILREINRGELDLYIGIRPRHPHKAAEGIEVIASGFTFEEIQVVDRAYIEIRDRYIGDRSIEKLPLLFAPVDRVSLVASGIRHHGVLMIAEKGVSLRIPEKLLSGANLSVYGQVFSDWTKKLEGLVHDDFRKIPRVQVRMMDLGRFDSIPSREGLAGVVIGAPHGTYDEYTAEIVKRLGFRTGLAAVIARGFSPTEAGGWRINVNRPSEKTYLAPEFEVRSSRSRETYSAFRDTVIDAAGGELRLYFDVHQYGGSSIQIATMGVTAAQAQNLKQRYQRIRDQLLKENPDIERVKLMIEPQDDVEIGAWPAKAYGILGIARKSVHIELPLHSALRSEKSRDVYTRIVSELIKQAVQDLWSPTGKPVVPSSAPLGRNPEREPPAMAGLESKGRTDHRVVNSNDSPITAYREIQRVRLR